ncbi:MAG: hypothetical protein H7175_15760 [Burkholderiales bacterium]|nr:hypothetical protein [Anaerolineae bacterium]
MAELPRLKRLLIEAMAKHLPPSAASLRLLDVRGETSDVLTGFRKDLDVVTAPEQADQWQLEADSVDAVVAYTNSVNDDFLNAAMIVLRPGGRLIVVNPDQDPNDGHVTTLEGAGYTRILVETAAECPLPVGVLMRGEKPHTTNDTLERVQQVAARDSQSVDLTFADLTKFKGRYAHLLIRQMPNKPVWSLEAGEAITWQAAALETPSGTALLVFSSLPQAVAFMQPAVMNGQIKDVNKVGKFSRETAQAWTLPVLLNPALSLLEGLSVAFVNVDADSAEAPDE